MLIPANAMTMEHIRAMFDSAYGPVIVEEVLEYNRENDSARFIGRGAADAKQDEYVAYLSDIRLTPVVA